MFCSYLCSDQSFIENVLPMCPWADISDQVCGKAGGTLEINRDEQSATPGDLNLNPL